MSTLAVIILTKNEERNIEAVIQNARQVTDEVIIVDSGSTDATIALAQKAGAKTTYRAWDNNFAAQRNFGLTQTKADWVLYLDADERLDKQAVSELKAIVSQNKPMQGGLRRTIVSFGYVFMHGIFTPDLVWRLFPRMQVTWKNKVHEHPECSLPQQVLKGKIIHYSYEGWHQWVAKVNSYTTIWAKDNAARVGKKGLGCAFGHAFYGFVRAYFFQLGFLDGWMGLYSSLQHFFYTMLKYLKLCEEQQEQTKDGTQD